MRLRDYLKQVEGAITFVILDAEKAGGSFYSDIYRNTPIRQKWEWEQSNEDLLNTIVVRKTCTPIETTGIWEMRYKRGELNCCMITHEKTLYEMYSEKQAKEMIAYYERVVK